jgi:tetratricopeptide (TPR) repeat protein
VRNPFLLFTLLLPVFIHAQQADTMLILQQAFADYKEGRLVTAFETTNKLIAHYPGRADFYDLRGDIQLKMKDYDHALNDFSRAIEMIPGNPLFYHHRANFYYTFQMPDEAIKDNDSALAHIIKDDTFKYDIITNRGNAKNMKRDFQGAYDDYMLALNFDSTSPAVLVNISAVLDDLNRGDEAFKYLERMIRLHPNDVGGYGNLGFRYMDKGEYEKAIEQFNKVLRLSPKDPLGFNNRGYAEYKLNKLSLALQDINRSLELYPENSFAYKNRALVYLAMKDHEKACADLEKAETAGFTQMYGDEVKKLRLEYCLTKAL